MPINFVSNLVLPFPRDYTSRGSSRSRPPPPPQGKRDFRREVREDFNRSAISVLSFNYSCLFQGISLLCRGGRGSGGQWAFWMGQLSSYCISDDFHLSIQVFTPFLYPGPDLHFNAHCTTHPAIFPLCMSKGENMPFSITIYIQDIDHFHHIFILAFKVVQEYERAVIFR